MILITCADTIDTDNRAGRTPRYSARIPLTKSVSHASAPVYPAASAPALRSFSASAPALRSFSATFSLSVVGGYLGACELHFGEGRHSTRVVGLGPVKKTQLSRPFFAASLSARGPRTPVVGPPLHQVADVDSKVAGLGGDRRPKSGARVLDL